MQISIVTEQTMLMKIEMVMEVTMETAMETEISIARPRITHDE